MSDITAEHNSTMENIIDKTTCDMIDINSVPYDGNYSIIGGSPVQLIKGLTEMTNSLESNEDKEKADMYNKIKELSVILLDNFKQLLCYYSNREKEIKTNSLCGKNGRIHTYMGKYPYVANINPMTKYKYTNFGYYIQMLKHRFKYLSTRDIPQSFITNDDKNIFNSLKIDADAYLKIIEETIEPQWLSFVNENKKTNKSVVETSDEKYIKVKRKNYGGKKHYKNQINKSP